MTRIVEIILALALTAGGALWLMFIFALAEHISSNLIAAACIVLAMGAYWLWSVYIHTPQSQDR